ncbi:Ppx/GppA phosphatase family protein [Agaribacterium haliotis]|uniref:Ppx/GppA phosphatase family protein n=1 Tax=Agaribacterium haliotis TaxID=2013869 RepID=UPI000BB57C38|nr:Ppx/GppA phosphatase family protein [Agaribacterium haliotis]
MARSPYFAAIDLGSNSFHMIIGRSSDGQFEIIDREKEMVQIARGLDHDGVLSDEAKARALDCLQRFSERLRDLPEEQVRAVGTKTLRAAKNSAQFLRKAESALGHSIEIISGFEEARLVYQGLSHSVADPKRQRLVIDIGGGSTEFIIGKSSSPQLLESLNMGCVAHTNRFFKKKSHLGEALNKSYMAACAELESIRQPYLRRGWELAFGTSGTMKAVAAVLNNTGGAVIKYDELCQLMQELMQGRDLDDDELPKLRRDVLPAGIAIIKAICDQLKIEQIQVADASLKDGLIYETIGRFSNEDIRENTVQQLLQRFKVDDDQAQRVSQTAMSLWQQLKQDEPRLPGVSRTKVLRWAALLHECGLSISHSAHHKHAYYLLKHSDLAGFGRFEQFCIASLLRFQRKKIRSGDYDSIDQSIRPAFEQLLLCLRLAVRLNRRREDQKVTFTLRLDRGVYVLSFQQHWLELNPLSRQGLLDEVSQLNSIGMHLLLEEAS